MTCPRPDHSIACRVTDDGLTRALAAVHAIRFDKDHGRAGGPDNFYNGVLYAERVLRAMTCPRDDSCLDDTCCGACPNCCKEGD